MRWTSMELAALATRAVPGLTPTGVADAPDDARDFMAAVVVDASGNRWRVRGPQHSQAGMRLETEVQVLRGFSTAIRAELPFRVPSVAGATRVGEMRVFVYNHLPGSSWDLGQLAGAGGDLTDDLGRTIAAVHDLSESVVDHAELPRYGAERVRQRRLNELDAAAATGKVPPLLLRRWEHAMEDRQLWDFSATVVHGDLHEDNLLIEGQRVVAVTGWTDLHIGDPADDLAWLIASPDQGFSEAVVEAYRTHRGSAVDEHILRRAALAAEFALAQWLVRGQSGENQQMTDEALSLLNQLASDIETYGGRAIALTPAAEEQSHPPADVQDSKPVTRPGAAATIADSSQIHGAEARPGGYPAADEESKAPREAESTQWDQAEDDEPAVITDADAAADVAAEQLTENLTPLGSAAGAWQAHSVEPDDAATEQIPAYVEHHFDDEAPTDSFAPVTEPKASTGSLPIRPDASSEKRAKQKNFFPVSAASAASGRSAHSAQSASSSSAASADSAAGTAQESGAAASAGESAEPTHSPPTDDDGSASRESVYSRHPGLRPPG